MVNLLIITIYIVEILNYYVAYRVLFKDYINSFTIPMIGALLLELIYFATSNNNSALIIGLFFIPIIVMIASQLFKNPKGLLKIFILVFFETCFTEIIAKPLEYFFPMKTMQYPMLIENLTVYSLMLAIWGLVYIIDKSISPKSKSGLQSFFVKAINVLIFITAWGILLSAGLLSSFDVKITDLQVKSTLIYLSWLLYASVGLLAFLSYYLYRNNIRVTKMVRTVISLKKMQQEYYDTLLEKEKDTRKFRHDMVNHFICLDTFLQNKNTEACRNYLGQMKEHVQSIQKKNYPIGNEILEILTAHYVAQLDSSTTVSVSGHIHTVIDELKLCTIYANLLQNAVEEIARCDDEKQLEISFKQGQEYFQIDIWNSLSEIGKASMSKRSFRTSKSDKENHGLGLINVKNTVAELGGRLLLENEDDFFHASVVLKSI